MITLYISFAVNTVLLLTTLFWAKRKPYKTDEKVLAAAGESPATGIMALFCLAVSYFLLYAKFSNSAVAGADQPSYWFIGGLSVVSAVLGCYNLLYTFVRKYMILPDRLVSINLFGMPKFLYWEDIQSVNIPVLTKNLHVKASRGSCLIRSGNYKQYKKFVETLKRYLPKDSGADIVSSLYERL